MVNSTSATSPETLKPSGMEQQKNSPALIGCKTISHGREPGQLEKGGVCDHRKLYTRIFDNKLHNSAPSVLWSVTAFESTTESDVSHAVGVLLLFKGKRSRNHA